MRSCLLAACTVGIAAADVPQIPLPVEVTAPGVAPGAIAQIRLTLRTPRPIASGSLSMELDPMFFGPLSTADVFSAAGDQVGYTVLKGDRIDVTFRSASGGIGRLPGVPVLVVNVPVLPSAAPGTTTTVRCVFTTPWRDISGYHYAPSATPAPFRVGGNFSIDSVTPGGGLLPSGTQVRIVGRGFTPSTAVQIDHVVLSSVTFRGPQAIDVILGAPADLAGRRMLAKQPEGTVADFYPALLRALHGTVQPIFPQQAFVEAELGSTNGPGFALQNPTLKPVDVTLRYWRTTRNGLQGDRIITLETGGSYVYVASVPQGPQLVSSSVRVISQTPIRAMSFAPEVPYAPVLPPLSVQWDGPTARCIDSRPFLPAQPRCWLAVAGADPLQARLNVRWIRAVPFSVTADTGGAEWLTFRTESSNACVTGGPCSPQITLVADPRLPPGDYNATVTVTPEDGTLLPVTLSFVFRVTRSVISIDAPPYIWFSVNDSIYSRGPARIPVHSTAESTPFTVSIQTWEGYPEGWISVTPTEGVTPATLDVYVNPPPSQTAGIAYIRIAGPSNTVTAPVNMVARTGARLLYPIAAFPPSLTFWAKPGTAAPAPLAVSLSSNAGAITVETEQGGAWLSVPTPAAGQLSVAANPTGLRAGIYRGTVRIAPFDLTLSQPGELPVKLVVYDDPPAVSFTPSPLRVSASSGSYPSVETVTASTEHGSVSMSATASTAGGNPWLQVVGNRLFDTGSFYAPPPYGSLRVGFNAGNLPPGTYSGSLQIRAPIESTTTYTVPVIFEVTPRVPYGRSDGPPLATSIVNGATLTSNPVAPGEVVTLLGSSLGPQTPAYFRPDDGKAPTTLAGLRVLFDGVPAPILYASAAQANVVAPYEVAGRSSTVIVIEFNGMRFVTGAVVAAAAPGLFTLDGSGAVKPSPPIRTAPRIAP